MKRQINTKTTDVIVSSIEKDYRCIIERESQQKEADRKPLVADWKVAGAGGGTTMNLPCHSMSFVNDKEVKMASGQRISIVVGDLAQQKVF